MASELTIAPARMTSSMAVPVLVARSLRRLIVIGIAIALGTWGAGWAVERVKFGADLQTARNRLEREVAAQFSVLGGQLERAVRAVTVDSATLRLAEQRDLAATRALFERVSAAAVSG